MKFVTNLSAERFNEFAANHKKKKSFFYKVTNGVYLNLNPLIGHLMLLD